MGAGVLKSEKGGYSKTSVLTKIDALNALLYMTENENIAHEKIRAELEKVMALELKREKSGFFGAYGFSVEDTDEYIAKLEAQIEEKLR
ncbi:MAG: hypothetical protein K6A79_05820 [Ruminococcus sp.]|nr:hypothetical protein [Ruminococcus sp.]MCR5075302.1 hypothetical protein [Ruminococcus sp.]